MLSPKESAGTPIRSSIDRCRFVKGVSFGVADVPARLDGAVPLPGEEDRQVVVAVGVAVADPQP